MLHLVYSNHIESLVTCLAQITNTERNKKTLWDPIQIVVPNPTLREYLRIGLAKYLRIAANLTFSYIDEISHQLTAQDGCQILNATIIQNALLALLSDSSYLVKPELNPVNNYLKNDPSDLKLIQLVSTLSKLYNNYAINYPNLIKAWRKQQHFIQPLTVTETWQKKLWLDAVTRLDQTGLRYLTSAETITLPLEKNSAFKTIHIFGMPQLANTYYQVLEKLKQLYDIYIYTLNPCQEFWEDLVTESEISSYVMRTAKPSNNKEPNTFNAASQIAYDMMVKGPEALKLWGLVGRENINALNTIGDYDFDSKFKIPEIKTLLTQVQCDILLFQEATKTIDKPDSSIVFLACPNYRREVEVIATEIWKLISSYAHDHKQLSFSDIAVVIPPNTEEIYIPNIQVAFKDTQNIPWIHKESATNTLKEVIEVIKLLLELPLSDFPRTLMLNIAAHPIITKRFGEIDIKLWLQWCEELGIIRGTSTEEMIDTYLEEDVLNWNQGLRRIALGMFMADDKDLNGTKYNYTPLAVANKISSGYFIAFMRSLINDAVNLKQNSKNIANWLTSIENYLTNWLCSTNDSVAATIDRIFRFLRDSLMQSSNESLVPKLSYNAIRLLVIESLTNLSNQQPNNLYGGVIVADYAQIQSIPFKIHFLLGLGPDVFPRKDRYHTLDLGNKISIKGSTSQSEKDKYEFLETIISTRHRLYLSYIYVDDITGESLEPSVLYKQLHNITSQYLAKNITITYHPLHRFDPKYFCRQLSNINSYKGNQLDNYSYLAYSECRALIKNIKTQYDDQGSTNQKSNNSNLNLNNKVTSSSVDLPNINDKMVSITISDLKRWLECPLTGSAAIHLGLRNNKPNILAEEELFATNKLDSYALLRKVTLQALHNGRLEETYDNAIKKLKNQGRSPFGLFASLEKNQCLAIITSWLSSLNEHKPMIWRLGLNRADEAISSKQMPSLEIKINNNYVVNLIGELQPQINAGSLFFAVGKPQKVTSEIIRKKILRAYVDQVIRTCIVNEPSEHSVLLSFAEETGKAATMKTLRLDPIHPTDSFSLLNNWLHDIITNNSAVLMPIEAILAMNDCNDYTPNLITSYVSKHIEQGNHKFSSLYGSVPDPQYYLPPTNLTNIIQERFGTFLKQIQKLTNWQS